MSAPGKKYALLLDDGECSPVDKVEHAEKYGFSAVILGHDRGHDFFDIRMRDGYLA